MSAEHVRPGTRRAAVAAFGVGAAVGVVAAVEAISAASLIIGIALT